MRTLQIGDLWVEEDPGGLSRYYYELLENFNPDTVSVRGLVVGSPAVVSSSRGKVRAFASASDSLLKRMLKARSAILKELANSRPDLLVSHFAVYSAPILDKLKTVPNVFHFHGPWSGESGAEGSHGLSVRVKAMLERPVYQRANRVITLSRAFRKILLEYFHVPEERIRIVPGGVDLNRFQPAMSRLEARERLGWPTDRPVLLSVRRLVHRMGLEKLVEAGVRIVAEVPDALIYLGGSGPIAGELQRLIDERSLGNHVRLIGRISEDDLPIAYRAADMTVVPTTSLEGFGLITLESLAVGTPVFVTPVGGLPEVVEPFAPQCVFEAGSVDAIADRLTHALLGKIRVPTSDECRAYAVANYSWQRIAALVADVYAEALRP